MREGRCRHRSHSFDWGHGGAEIGATIIDWPATRSSPDRTILGSSCGKRGLAAAEIVAFWLGHPDQHCPDELQEWARRHADGLSPEFISLARQAVATIKANSELKDLWEEGDGIVAPKWYKAIADLERRLEAIGGERV